MKTALIVGAVVVILVAIGAFGVANLDRLIAENEGRIVEAIEDKVGRTVEFGNIGVSVWGGVGARITGLRVSDDPEFSDEQFITARSVRVGVELLPLLGGELRLTELVLEEPRIRVIKDARGRYNFSSLTGGDKAGEPKDGEQTAFFVSRVSISNGGLHYIDMTREQPITITRLDLELEDLSLDGTVGVTMKAALVSQERNIELEARIGPLGSLDKLSSARVEGKLAVDGLDFARVRTAFPEVEGYLPVGLGLRGPVHMKTAFSGDIRDLSLEGLSARAAVFGAEEQNLRVSGDIEGIGGEGLSLEGEMSLKQVELAELMEFDPLRASVPEGLTGSGPVDIELTVNGTPGDLSLESALDATNAQIALGTDFFKPRGVRLTVESRERVRPGRIEIEDSTVRLKSLLLYTSGTVFLEQTPRLDLRARTEKTRLDGWERLLPALGARSLAGSAVLDAEIRGPVGQGSSPDIHGTIDLRDAGMALERLPGPVHSLNARVVMQGSTATVDGGSLYIGDSRLDFSARAQSLSPLRLSYQVTSPELRIADLIPADYGSSRGDVIKGLGAEGTVSLAGGSPVHNGRVTSSAGRLWNIAYDSLGTGVSLTGGVLKLEGFTIRTLDGHISLDASYDTGASVPSFGLKTTIAKLSLPPLLSAFTPIGGEHIRGDVDLALSLAGRGSGWEEISRTLTGSGTFKVFEGEVVSQNLAVQVFKKLSQQKNLEHMSSAELEKRYPRTFKTKSTAFQDLHSSFEIKDGKIMLDDLLLVSDEFKTSGAGWIGLDQTMNIDGLLTLNKQVSSDLVKVNQLFRYMRNTRGMVQIPITTTGSLTEPRFSPNIPAIAALLPINALRLGPRILKEGLGKLYDLGTPDKGASEPSPSSTPGPPDSPEEIIKEGVKGLFKSLGRKKE